MRGVAVLLLGITPLAFAARPLATEDASVLDAGRCQLEAWIDRSREATQRWLVPACNFGAPIEWQLGLARGDAYAQAKVATAFDPRGFAVGAVAGVIRGGTPYVTVPFSALLGDSAMVHLNGGWIRDRAVGKSAGTWGAALEKSLRGDVTLLAEAFSVDGGKPFGRVGGRYTAIKDRLDLDLSVVSRAGANRSDRLISLGFLYQTGRFPP